MLKFLDSNETEPGFFKGREHSNTLKAPHSLVKTNSLSTPIKFESESVLKDRGQSSVASVPSNPADIDYTQINPHLKQQIEQGFQDLMKRFGHFSKGDLVKLLHHYYSLSEINQFNYNNLLNFVKLKYASDQDEDLKAVINKSAMQINYGLHLVYVFSSPLVWIYTEENGERKIRDYERINYQEEFPRLKRALKKFEKKIQYQKIFGTKENFENIFS